MLHNNRCPRCSGRVASLSGKCSSCGSLADTEALKSIRRKVAVALVTVVVTGGFLATWISGDGARNIYDTALTSRLSDSAFRLVPMADQDRAFYVCARAAVRRIGTDSSIITFAERTTVSTVSHDDGRVEIRAFLEESQEAGVLQYHAFTCTLEESGGEWVLSSIDIQETEGPPVLPLARAR